MKRTSTKLIALLAIMSSASALPAIDFEDLPSTLPPAMSYGPGGVYYNGSDSAGGFTSGGAYFANSFTDYGSGFTAWNGWAYSTTTDTTTPGFGNQYSAYSGTAFSGSTYGVGYFSGGRPTIDLGAGQSAPLSMRVTNTTYAGLDMLNGSGFSKQFGGVSGDDPDWFLLTARSYDGADQLIGTVEFYLADYRFADNSQDYIVNSWELVDLTGLGFGVASIDFELTSSDNDPMFGINTPSYFAMDDFTAVPEPSAFTLTFGLIALGVVARRRA